MSREALLCQGVRKGKVFENVVLMVVLPERVRQDSQERRAA